MTLFEMLPALLWLVGAGVRLYRQLRFYQMEEYKAGRYLRWMTSDRARWLPARPIIAALLGGVLAVMFSEGGTLLPTVIASGAAVAGSIPPSEGEIKKPLRRTPRAIRLFVVSLAL
ncbi:MAG: hypothetical protein H7Y11_15495, partial [Armatimonadetes bacterium]|nr:hypothetical protein [Anaerolineae bacterium]